MESKRRFDQFLAGAPFTNGVPAAFFQHFRPDQRHGQAALRAQMDFARATGMDMIKIMFDDIYPKASLITPPTGAVGPMTICMLAYNSAKSVYGEEVDEVLEQGIKSITDLITSIGDVNVDFADITTMLTYRGMAYMGIGEAEGEGRMIDAVNQAIDNALTENKINNAKGVIFNVRGNSELALSEINDGIGKINDLISEDANVVFGTITDESLGDKVVVTVIATGVE